MLLLAACAHTREEVNAAVVTPEPPPPSAAQAEPEVVEPAPASRPRLSRTITLGQGTEWQYTPAAAVPPKEAAAAPSQSVVVNNNIVVQGGAPGYYGYGGFYGSRGYGRPTTFYNSDGFRGGRPRGGSPAWGAAGWEGARRTAAPGQTPGVGGNWSPPPSYGPAQMR